MGFLPSYPLLLVLHLVAVSVFGSVALLVAVTLPAFSPDTLKSRRDELRRLHLMNRYAGLPALACIWALGLSLAASGGWFGAGWLDAKITLVVLVSILHLRQGAILRRFATGASAVGQGWRYAGLLAALLLAIVVLVSAKPG